MHGTACDNLVGAQLVTADGEVLELGLQHNEDLFWAIRGGGGNFCIVTRLNFRLYPVQASYNAKFNCHFKNHDELKRDIHRNPQLSRIYDDYRDLLTFSWNARYQPNNYGETEIVEARDCHTAVADHIRGLL